MAVRSFIGLASGGNVVKLFTSVVDEFSLVLGKLLQPNLMFVGDARSLPYSEACERHFIWVGSSLTRKH
jgi:hypothetical protein